ncbi:MULTISPECIES: hypothetical protein [unclassified Streptomyces]|uniref:hypothetical protein n=1 Tax=unclassified Streptomyces TaxID=2593676 RepID=UPI002E2A568A|nr:hypothetical protein [Streptomyces sp. NBC_00223]
MSWLDESGRHEGYLVAVLADGGEPAPEPGARKPWWSYNGADGPRAIGVKGACVCGWRGAEAHPIHRGDDEATEGYEAPTGPYADWDEHVTLTEGLVPYDVEQMLAALERRIAELSERRPLTALRVASRIEKAAPGYSLGAVRAARSGLVSWEAVGQAFGTSRQAAHERFARHLKN